MKKVKFLYYSPMFFMKIKFFKILKKLSSSMVRPAYEDIGRSIVLLSGKPFNKINWETRIK